MDSRTKDLERQAVAAFIEKEGRGPTFQEMMLLREAVSSVAMAQDPEGETHPLDGGEVVATADGAYTSYMPPEVREQREVEAREAVTLTEAEVESIDQAVATGDVETVVQVVQRVLADRG